MSHKPFISQLVIVLAVIAFFSAIGFQLQRRAPVQEFDRFPRIASALEAYALDHNGQYPSHGTPGISSDLYYLPISLTTPVAYLSAADLFDPLGRVPAPGITGHGRYRYVNIEMAYAFNPSLLSERRAVYGSWILWSVGYDQVANGLPPTNIILYDPTNGLMSAGDMIRTQRMQLETGVE